MLDDTSVFNPSHSGLVEMIASVSGAHGKGVLLSQEAAARENNRLPQSLSAAVWAQAPAGTKALMTLYTYGVNGVSYGSYYLYSNPFAIGE